MKELWISLDPQTLLRTVREQRTGTTMSLSVYDVPSQMRIAVDEGRKVLELEFRYMDNEQGTWTEERDGISIKMGNGSRKLLGIKLSAKRLRFDSLIHGLEHAEDDPKTSVYEDRDNLRRRTIDSVLQSNRTSIEDLIPA